MDKKNKIPTLYATAYRCIAITGNIHFLVPEVTPSIATLCDVRGISYQSLGLAKSIMLTYKYLKKTFETNAVRNSKDDNSLTESRRKEKGG